MTQAPLRRILPASLPPGRLHSDSPSECRNPQLGGESNAAARHPSPSPQGTSEK